MAAGEYLKSAVSSLYRAADSLKQQVKELQAKQAVVSDSSDQRQQSRLAARIAKLQAEIMAAEQKLEQAETDLQNAASD
jgi:predicted RNase H-like nuclease (RuvC/YqgF family)